MTPLQRRSAASKRAARTRRRLAQADPARLTGRCQRALYAFIIVYEFRHGVGPTRAEMRAAVEHRSGSWISVVLNTLEARGYITRKRHTYRGVHSGGPSYTVSYPWTAVSPAVESSSV